MVSHVCHKALQARSLCPHLSSALDIHQQVVVADKLLEERSGVRYRANPGGLKDPIQCPYPGCPGVLSTPYMLHHHFRDLHPKETVEIPREGTFPRCKHCTMQCNPQYPRHIHTQVCLLVAEQRTQWDLAVTVALALHKLFHVDRELLEKVDLFRYLGWILAQNDDDVRAVRNQIKKAWGIWARVGQVLMVDNTPLKVSTKFYKVCPPIWQQDLEPLHNCLGTAGGVSYLRSLPDGRETQAKERNASCVGVSTVLQRSEGVWYGHHVALH
jgi:hypothetical protein